MTTPNSTSLSEVRLLGPAIDEELSLWRDSVRVVYDGKTTSPVPAKTHGVRVLMQDAEPSELLPDANGWSNDPALRGVPFHTARLLQLTIRSSLHSNLVIGESSPLRVTEQPITRSSVIVAPLIKAGKAWATPPNPYSGKGEVALPAVRLVEGRIRIHLSANTKDSWLGLDENARKVFAGDGSPGVEVVAQQEMWLDLTPDGVEFAAKVPNPLQTFGQPGDVFECQLRLCRIIDPVRAKMRYGLRLVDADPAVLVDLRAALAKLDSNVKSPLLIRPDVQVRVPPLVWWLDETKDGLRFNFRPTSVSVTLDAAVTKPLLRTDAALNATLPSAAEIDALAVSISFDRATKTTTVRVASFEGKVPETWEKHETLGITWSKAAAFGAAATLKPGKGQRELPLTIDRSALQSRLTTLYRAAGAIPTDAEAQAVYVPVERGVLQLPLTPQSQAEQVALRRAISRGSFRGVVSANLAGNRDAVARMELVASAGMEITTTWTAASLSHVKLSAYAPRAAVLGVFWTLEASPTPEEMVPGLQGGPIALRTVALEIGESQDPHFRLSTQEWDSSTPFVLLVRGSEEVKAFAHAYLRHAELPLVASASMLRSAGAASEPSRSRHLFPHEWEIGAALPPLTLTSSAGAWRARITSGLVPDHRWPWPKESKAPSVAMLPVTLPGVELTPPSGTSPLRARLRFDLPILDELFASAILPRTAPPPDPNSLPLGEPLTTAGAPVSAKLTTLDADRLQNHWTDVAARLSLADTQAVDATPWLAAGGVPVAVDVAHLIEPFVLKSTFAFASRAALGSTTWPIGAYHFAGSWVYGETALRGLSASYWVDGDRLSQVNNGQAPYDVIGFAAASRIHNSFAFDQRGSALALLPNRSTSLILRRAKTSLRDGAHITTRNIELTTLSGPLEVDAPGGNKTGVKFWFRDLPLQGGRFDGAGNPLEGSAGPNDRLFDRDALIESAYEWRLFDSSGPAFSIALGRYRFVPLRLMEVNTDAAQAQPIRNVRVLGRLAMAEDGATAGPFGAEHPYAAANLVELSLTASGSKLAVESLKRRKIVREGKDDEGKVEPSEEPLVFGLSADVTHANVAAPERINADLALLLDKGNGVDGDGPMFANIELSAILFGSHVSITGKPIRVGDAFEARWTWASTGDQVGIDVEALTIRWWPLEVNGRATLHIVARALFALRADANGKPRTLDVVEWRIGDRLRWLGAQVDLSSATQIIDHSRGIVTLQMPSISTAKAIIRGLAIGSPAVPACVSGALMLHLPLNANALGFGKHRIAAGVGSLELRLQDQRNIVRQKIHRGAPSDAWKSRLECDLEYFHDRSEIAWPINAPLPDGGWPGLAGAPYVKGSAVRVEFHPSPALEHDVSVVIRGHTLTLSSLSRDADDFFLERPWRFKAMVHHRISDPAGRTWDFSSLDDVMIADVEALIQEAQARRSKSEWRYAFAARYVEDFDATGESMPTAGPLHPGIIERAVGHAGFPVDELSDALSAWNGKGLVATGSGVLAVELERADGKAFPPMGLTFSMPWLVSRSTSVDPALPNPLSSLRQTVENGTLAWEMADIDVGAGSLVALGGAPAQSFNAADGHEASLRSELERAFTLFKNEGGRAQMPVEQAFYRPAAGAPQVIAPQATPFWLRTLVALRTIWSTSSPKSVTALVALGRNDGHAAALILSGSGTKNKENESKTSPMNDLLVLAPDRLRLVELAGANAHADGPQLRSAAGQAVMDPLVAVFAERDPEHFLQRRGVGEAIASADAWHVEWTVIDALAPHLPLGAPARALRRDEDAMHPSAALGWPTGNHVEIQASLSVGLGAERVFQSERGFAARAGQQMLPSRATAGDGKGPDAYFIALADRVVFERPPLAMRAPPAHHLAPLPARARMPLAVQLDAELMRIREDHQESAPTIAPLVPGPMERTTVGARPGVLHASRVGMVVPLGDERVEPTLALDDEHVRFGRPAGFGPALFRQSRSPRSPAFPRERSHPGGTLDPKAAERRRRTFVAWDRHDAEDAVPFLRLDGPACLWRVQKDKSEWSQVSHLLTVKQPLGGVISAQFSGRIELAVNSIKPVHDVALEIQTRARATLVVDGWGARFLLSARPGAAVVDAEVLAEDAAELRRRLGAATANSRVELVLAIRPTFSLIPPIPDELEPLSSILRLVLSIRPTDRPVPALLQRTVIFGDPAYDQELSGPAKQGTAVIAGKLFMIAVDRAEYDAGESLILAAGEIQVASGEFVSDPAVSHPVTIMLLRNDSAGDTQEYVVAIAGAITKPPAEHTIRTATAYKVALSSLLIVDKATGVSSRAQPRAGDTVRFSIQEGASFVSVEIRVVAQPVLSPPSAVYGLVGAAGAGSVAAATAPLFATAPLPSAVEPIDAVLDLALGTVRRHALFVWSYVDDIDCQLAALVKVDRTGGAQLPDRVEDFRPLGQ